MATKHLAATYNREGFPMISNTTWCMTGDACIQEGIGLEVISLAGHWRLNNLVLIYGNNQITCDGSVDMVANEDINEKMRACGWDVLGVEDGCYDVLALVKAMTQAKRSTEKQTFINVRPVIRVGSAVEGRAKVHGAAFGPKEVANINKRFGFSLDEHFVVPDEVYDFLEDVSMRGEHLVAAWGRLLQEYKRGYPHLGKELGKRMKGKWVDNWKKFITKREEFPTTPTPSRESAGLVCNPLARNLKNIMVGLRI